MKMRGDLYTMFGTLMLCISMLIWCIVGTEVYNQSRWQAEHALGVLTLLFAFLGLLFLVGGILLFLRKSYSRSFAGVILLLTMLAWIYLSIDLMRDEVDEGRIMWMGLSVLVLTLLLVGLLLLGHRQFTDPAPTRSIQDDRPDILDL
ncbi:MAG: hypothetical protein AAFO94_05290 [Bacteroidota bacterium]